MDTVKQKQQNLFTFVDRMLP